MQRYLLKGQTEIIDFARGNNDRVDSEMLYPANLTRQVLLARRLNLSFTRDIPDARWPAKGLHADRHE